MSELRKESTYTIVFMVVLSLTCAIILSVLASVLKQPQEIAKDLDRSKQMLIAARILNPAGYFQIEDQAGNYIPAKVEAGGVLKPTTTALFPNKDEILQVYQSRIQPILVNDQGILSTFKKENIDEKKYLGDYRKSGYYRQPYKLLYKIFENPRLDEKITDQQETIIGYVIPVNGMGLWDAIYGYLAVKTDGNTVIGISWYDQKETPGLGANISEADWQSQFPGKHLFQTSSLNDSSIQNDPLGIIVVKGKVQDVLGNSPKAKSAVDGMAGATLTGNGVTNAYRDVLAAYRPFLLKLNAESKQKNKESTQ